LTKDFGIPISSSASYFAGHSSGEYSACVASNAITFAEGVKLTRLHGLLTSRTLQLSSLKTYSDHSANDEERAQMSALVLHHKKGIEDVLKVVKETRESNKGNAGMVEVASYNSVGCGTECLPELS
jgi:malonyl CoA-acyl carrier protein transacylase